MSVSANQAPVLTAIPDVFANVLTPLVISAIATDPDARTKFAYSLDPSAPTNATINPDDGTLHWTPTRAQAPGTNTITVHVTDDGTPPLSNSMSFTVYVNDYIELTTGSLVTSAGESNSVPIDVFSSAELAGLQCAIHLAGNRLTNIAVESLSPQLATVSLQIIDANTAALIFTAMPGQTIQGTQHLARLSFTAISGQTSGFFPLHVSSLNGTRAGAGLTPTLLANDGRIVVVGAQPLLEQLASGPGQRQAMLYGKIGVTYRIEYSTNLADKSSWKLRGTQAMTNLFRALSLGTSPAPPVFYRARQ